MARKYTVWPRRRQVAPLVINGRAFVTGGYDGEPGPAARWRRRYASSLSVLYASDLLALPWYAYIAGLAPARCSSCYKPIFVTPNVVDKRPLCGRCIERKGRCLYAPDPDRS